MNGALGTNAHVLKEKRQGKGKTQGRGRLFVVRSGVFCYRATLEETRRDRIGWERPKKRSFELAPSLGRRVACCILDAFQKPPMPGAKTPTIVLG